MRRLRSTLTVLAFAIFSFHTVPVEAGLAHLLPVLIHKGTIQTPLHDAKQPVAKFVNTGVKRVVLIVLENGSPDEAKNQSFMINRADEGMVLNKYFAVAHPSQPNYIALISGSLAGTNGDSTSTLHRDHLGMRIPGRWKVYAEDYPTSSDPGICSPVKQDGAYVRRHVPFLSFSGVDCRAIVRLNTDGTTRKVSGKLPAARDVAKVTKALRDDIASGTLPAFAMIIPNLTDDGHAPSNMTNANDWLTRYIAPLLHDPAFTEDTVFILTFDEDEGEGARRPNRVYTVIWGDHVQHGTVNDVYDHEDLFITIAALLQVSPLPSTEETGTRLIGGIWK